QPHLNNLGLTWFRKHTHTQTHTHTHKRAVCSTEAPHTTPHSRTVYFQAHTATYTHWDKHSAGNTHTHRHTHTHTKELYALPRLNQDNRTAELFILPCRYTHTHRQEKLQ